MTTTPASYPLGTFLKTPPEWAINLLADLYAAEIVGTHGFGLRHPRAPWLTLVVSSVVECFSCVAPARWEEAGHGTAFCARCAEAEAALVKAGSAVVRAVRIFETEPTVVEAFVPMGDLPRAGAVA